MASRPPRPAPLAPVAGPVVTWRPARGRGGSRVQWQLELEKPLDRATPALGEIAADARRVASGELVVLEEFGPAGRLVTTRLELTGLRIREREIRERRSGSGPVERYESLTLTAEAVRTTYVEREPSGEQRLRTVAEWTLGPADSVGASRRRGARSR